jgi:DNA-binding transcriptional LysR family regulator
MLDGVSFDQLRMFIAAAETGSFSAAGRRLSRAQSVVSQTIANLEAQIGVPLFTREGRYPALTEAGRLLLADARGVVAGLSVLKARAKSMSAGIEPELAVAVDVMFPMTVLTQAAAAFGEAHPNTPLRLYVEVLGGVAKAVLDSVCQFGIIGPLPLEAPALVVEQLLLVPTVVVASRTHPLARPGPALDECELGQHLQLVLTDRSELSKGRDFFVLSARNWRLADLSAKHAFLLAGLGWGTMPREMVARDLEEGRLVELPIGGEPRERVMSMSTTYRADSPPGPAGRWFLNKLKQIAG